MYGNSINNSTHITAENILSAIKLISQPLSISFLAIKQSVAFGESRQYP